MIPRRRHGRRTGHGRGPPRASSVRHPRLRLGAADHTSSRCTQAWASRHRIGRAATAAGLAGTGYALFRRIRS
ncbi:hypothetical protein DD630_27945 [Streptomyces sp. BSE7F]|nr:hypothetical protein DD630_27945 [Streptomyces sp. BSE7F]